MKTNEKLTNVLANASSDIWIHTPTRTEEMNVLTESERTSWFLAISDAQKALTASANKPRSPARQADLVKAVAFLVATHNEVRIAAWKREEEAKAAVARDEAHAVAVEYSIAAANAEQYRDLYHRPGSWVTDECMTNVVARYEAAVDAIAALPNRPGYTAPAPVEPTREEKLEMAAALVKTTQDRLDAARDAFYAATTNDERAACEASWDAAYASFKEACRNASDLQNADH